MAKKRTRIETLRAEGLQIELIRSSQRRTLSLEVSPAGIRARAPWRMPEADIRAFIRTKRNWLQRSLNALPEVKAPLTLEHGAHILFQGREYRIDLAHERGDIVLHGDAIAVPITRSHLTEHESARRKLIRWLKIMAQQHLEARVKAHAEDMLPADRPNPIIKVREYRRRWGSCDHRGELSFNWRIVQAPPEILNYVVVHEMAHLREFNHSKKFWQIVARHDPDWKSHQRWLANHGVDLYQF